ncbi:glycosyltransferase [Roseobacter sp. HKCCD5988]|uniref:glycosyltransferase n=1 Tax=Roseobacter sp. HKCCD5988 TaxID=3120338 RepID=UPI0030EE3005
MDRNFEIPVTVVMPVFNGMPHLITQINSILVQLQENDELLIVDDCSTDGSLEYLIETQARSMHDIKVYNNSKNMGVLENIKKLINLARCDVVIFADQDDEWLPSKIMVTKKEYSYQDLSLMVHNAKYICENSTDPLHNTTAFQHLKTSNRFLRNFIRNGFIGCCMAINRTHFPKKVIDNIPNSPMHDWYLSSYCFMKGKKVRIIDECLINHYRHSGAFTSKNIQYYNKIYSRYKLLKAVLI